MYKEIIRDELRSALNILKFFLKNDIQIDFLQKSAILIANAFKKKKKFFHVETEDLIAMLCILQKN